MIISLIDLISKVLVFQCNTIFEPKQGISFFIFMYVLKPEAFFGCCFCNVYAAYVVQLQQAEKENSFFYT